MAIQPKTEIVLDLEIKTYDLNQHITAWHKHARIGVLEHKPGSTVFSILGQTEVFSSRREALELLVRLWKIKNPVDPDLPYDRKAMNVLGEEIWVHAFRLSPDLAVWTTEGGFPLGTLQPVGTLWQRGCAQEAKSLQDCLEEMVREFHGERDALGVSVVKG